MGATKASQPFTLEHPAFRLSGAGHLDRPARRIISLLPSATEIVCALGLADRLVAVTHECDFPPSALVGLPRITANRLPTEMRRSGEIDIAVRAAVGSGHGLYALDERLMTELESDVVLTQELCHVCAVSYPTVLQAARTAGGQNGPVVVSLEPHTVTDVLETIRLVARLAGVDARGKRLAAALSRSLAAIRRPPRRPRIALIEWLEPLFAPGHWVPEQIVLAGGEPAVGVAGARSREMSWETLVGSDPEVIVLGLCGFDLARTIDEWATFEAPQALAQTPAWRDGQLWAIDGSAYISRPEPRLVDGVAILAAILAGRSDPRAVRLPRAG